MEQLFGRLAVHLGMIDMEQLAEATRLQARHGDGRMLGQILIELGYLDFDQLNEVLQEQRAWVESGASPDAPLDGSEPTSGAPPARAPTPAPLRPATPLGDLFEGIEGEPSIEPRAEAQRANLLETCLREAAALGASDVHAHPDTPLRIRLNGRLVSYGQHALAAEILEAGLWELLGPTERRRLDEAGHVDFVRALPGLRVRASVHRQIGGLGGVFRLIAERPPTLSELGLPTHLARVGNLDEGLVLITGPAGSGRTSAMAALIGLINEERAAHVVTIEAPVEHVHPPGRALVTQREVGTHTTSAARAIRAALREDPDVIAIGDLREPEAFSLALNAAETGHLVLATLTCPSAADAIQRFLRNCLQASEAGVQGRLADTLRAVVVLRLLPAARDDGRLAAHGLVRVTPAVASLIREDKLHQLDNVVRTEMGSAGHTPLDDRLAHLVKTGRITRAEAARHAESPDRFGAEAGR